MSVSNGQLANQTTFNNAFPSRTQDTSCAGKVALLNTDPESGDSIDSIQQELNAGNSYTGKPANAPYDALPAWENSDVGSGSDSLRARADALTERFNPTTGHTHDGIDSPPVDAVDLANVRLRGYFQRGANLTAVSGSSVDVSAQLVGKEVSTDQETKGVVVDPAYNQVTIRDNASSTEGEVFKDGDGDIVFARLTFLADVWTLSFYTRNVGGEAAYSFVSPVAIQWYYQELFNPLTDAPVYDPSAVTPSDNATQAVVDASATQRGAVSTGAQSFAGVKTFADTTQSTTKDNGAVVIEGGLGVEKNANIGGNAGVGGNVAATGTVTGSNLSGTNTGDVSLGTFGTTPDAKGATLAGQVLTLQPADNTHPGLVDILAQTWKGIKTFTDGIITNAFLALKRLDVASSASITQLASSNSFVKLTGATATTIHGALAGVDGQTLKIHNGSSATMTLKHQSVTATAVDRFKLPGGTDLAVDADSSVELIYDTGQSRWVISSGSGSGSGSGGGGGGVEWSEADNAPVFGFENFLGVYKFDASLGQQLWAMVKVPAGYTIGKQIRFRGSYYTPDTAGTIGLSITAYLVRTGTDSPNFTGNSQTSAQTTVLGAGTASKPQAVNIPLSDASGAFNGVQAQPGDYIRLKVERTDTVAAASELRVFKANAANEVTFNG